MGASNWFASAAWNAARRLWQVRPKRPGATPRRGRAHLPRGVSYAPEQLEQRLVLSPSVLSINRSSPATPVTGLSSVTYAVTFSTSVTGVDATDFQVISNGSAAASSPVAVAGSGAAYTVTISGIHGNGNLQLNLIDDDSIKDSTNTPLGGVGLYNGSFAGKSYSILPTFPTVLSINRANPPGPTTSAGTVSYTVTFSSAVTGVVASDFSLALSGVSASTPVVVTPVNSSVYTVSVNGVSGNGTLGLNLVDNGAIHDLAGNPLQSNAATSGSLQTQQTFTTGTGPASVIAADLNADGKRDLVIANQGSNTVSVLLGNGDGSFQAQKTFATGTKPESVAVADVNGDGKPDLIVANFTGNTVSVLLGNGNGTFQAQLTTNAASAYSVAIADVNGDGKPDIIVANDKPSGTVGVLLGNGNGTFQAMNSFNVGSHPYSVAVADVNGDGKLDIVAANFGGNSVSVLLGNGNGTFQAQKTFTVGTGPFSVIASDVSGDGNVDLIAANLTSGNVSVLLGNGNGTFQAQQTLAAGSGASSVATADLNGDGSPDLIVANRSANTISIFLGNGNGTFQTQQTFAVGTAPFNVAVADVNGDTKGDVLVADRGTTATGTTVGLLAGNGLGSFTGQTYTIVPPVTVSSINRSSPATPITSSSTLSYAVTFSGTVTGVAPSSFKVITTGSLAATTPVVVSGSGSSYTVTINGVHGNGTLQLELVDNDTILDGFGTPLGGAGVGNGSYLGQSYTILQTFPAVQSITRASPAGSSTNGSAVSYTVTFSGPVTGVDATDFALALSGTTATTPVVVTPVSGSVYTVTINGVSGNGTLGLNVLDDGSIRDAAGNPLQGTPASFRVPQTFAAGTRADSIAVADVNGDGQRDLVVANYSSNNVSVLLGNGNGTFLAQQTFAVGTQPSSVAVADINGDGNSDLLVANFASNTVSVLLGNGNGTFGVQTTFATGAGPHCIAVADVNGDGKPDLVVASYAGGVGVLLSNGDGTFKAEQTFAAGSQPASVAVSDVNADGKPDLVVANHNSNTVSVLLGNGNGTFQSQRTFATDLQPNSVAVSDVNADNMPDLVVGNNGSNSVSVLSGNGDGTFQAQQTFAAGSLPISVAVSDINGDGKPDVLVANYSSATVSLLLGNGNGTFQAQQSFATPTGSEFAAVTSDVNADGRPDVLVANGSGSSSVAVLLSNGVGSTGPTYAVLPPIVSSIVLSVPAGPITSATSVSYAVTFSRPVIGVAASTFQVIIGGSVAITNPVVVSGGGSSYTVTINGIHGSGTLQLELVDNDTATDSFGAPLGGTGIGNGSYTAPAYTILQTYPAVLSINRTSPLGPSTTGNSVSYTVTFSTAVTGVDATDFALSLSGVAASMPVVVTPVNGSVYTVTINGISGNGTLALNLVDDRGIHDSAGNPLCSNAVTAGSFSTMSQFPLAAGAVPFFMATADLNLDGKPDLVLADFGSNNVSVLLGNGDGIFQSARTFAVGLSPRSVAISDVNGDGNPDLIVADDQSPGMLSVLLGNGNGTFRAQQSLASGVYPFSVLAADVNGDGKADLEVANQGGNTVSVMLGNGDGTFLPQQTFAAGSSPWSVAAADLNGDGNPDLVVANKGGNTVSVLLGNGDGTFQPQKTFATGTFPFSVTVADVNGDARPDLVVANDGSTSASVLLGNGNGTFQAAQNLAAGLSPYSVAVADVSGDGQPDVLVANSGANTLSLLLGNGDGSFQAQQTLSTGSSPSSVAIADVNADGRPDLLFANLSGSTAGVRLGNGVGNFIGQTYNIAAALDTAAGTSGVDQITLIADLDAQHIDWNVGNFFGQMSINDPNGLTINGNGGNDAVTLQYSNGNPLPATVHLNGTFTVSGLSGTNPLANTTLEIGRSTVFINYTAGADPLAAIQGYLRAGYNNGAWNGSPTAGTGVITSTPAANNALQTTAIGYADSADGLISGQPANTVELENTLYGDTSLTGTVGSNDFSRLTLHYQQTSGGTWDTGDFNYDGSVNFNDFTLLTRTYNTSLGGQASPAVSAVSPDQLAATQTYSTPLDSASAGGNHEWSFQARPAAPTRPPKVLPDRHKKHRR